MFYSVVKAQSNDTNIAILLIIILLYILLALKNVLFPEKKEEDMQLDGDDNTCISCYSKNVSHPSEGINLCLDCGYEGGEGLALFYEKQRRANIAAMPEQERMNSALGDLEVAIFCSDSVITVGRVLLRQKNMEMAGIGLRARYDNETDEFFREVSNLERAMNDFYCKIGSVKQSSVMGVFQLSDWSLVEDYSRYSYSFSQVMKEQDQIGAMIFYVKRLKPTLVNYQKQLKRAFGVLE